jgi:hypothetical protein
MALSLVALERRLAAIERRLGRPLISVSGNDSTQDYLLDKVAAGTGITITETNDGRNEKLTITATGTGVTYEGDNPQPLGTPAPGTEATSSRGDHVHLLPSAADVGAAAAAHAHSVNSTEITDTGDIQANWLWQEGYKVTLATNYGSVSFENYGASTVTNAKAVLMLPSAAMNSATYSGPETPPYTYQRDWDWHITYGAANPPPNTLMYGGLALGVQNYMGLLLTAAPDGALPTSWCLHPQWRGRLVVAEVSPGGAQHLYYSRWNGSTWVEELIA